MLFKTRFDPYTALWQLQIKEPIAWFLPSSWKTVMVDARMPASPPGAEIFERLAAPRTRSGYWPKTPMSFESHGAAMDYVKKVGLDKQYSQDKPQPFAQFLAAGATA